MKRSDFPLKALALRGYQNPRIVRECHLPKAFKGFAEHTIANYGSALHEHIFRGNSLTSYHGPVHYPCVTLDLDRRKSSLASLAKALAEFIELLKFEHSIPTEYLRIYYSGANGFHLEIPSKIFDIRPGYNLEVKVSGLVRRLVSGLSVAQYVDWGVFTRHRLIRLNNSINPKSGKYKIAITLNELRGCYGR